MQVFYLWVFLYCRIVTFSKIKDLNSSSTTAHQHNSFLKSDVITLLCSSFGDSLWMDVSSGRNLLHDSSSWNKLFRRSPSEMWNHEGHSVIWYHPYRGGAADTLLPLKGQSWRHRQQNKDYITASSNCSVLQMACF